VINFVERRKKYTKIQVSLRNLIYFCFFRHKLEYIPSETRERSKQVWCDTSHGVTGLSYMEQRPSWVSETHSTGRRNRRFIAVLKEACISSLLWARWTKCKSPYVVSSVSVLTSLCHLHLELYWKYYLQELRPKIFYAFLISPTIARLDAPSSSIWSP
jgi:hypothetical protein